MHNSLISVRIFLRQKKNLLLPVELPLGYILLPDWPARGAGKSVDPLNVHLPSVAGGSAIVHIYQIRKILASSSLLLRTALLAFAS